MALPDVDRPTTWSAKLQIEFATGSGRARSIRGRYKALRIGRTVEWKDAGARDYWGRVIGDPNVYPVVP